jgi:hypothetical protein
MKSNQKSSQQKCFFALTAFTPQINQNHGLLNLTSTSFAHSSASARFANAPATAQAIIVLPAFARSCSADKERKKYGETVPPALFAAQPERGRSSEV